MRNPELEEGYVYGFSGQQVDKLEHLSFQDRFRGVALEGKREFTADQEELAKYPAQQQLRPKRVPMCAFRLDDQTPPATTELQDRFPGYALFFIVNRPVHEMLTKLGHFRFLGAIRAEQLRPSVANLPEQNVLKDEFYAFERGTNAHLWAS